MGLNLGIAGLRDAGAETLRTTLVLTRSDIDGLVSMAEVKQA